MSKRLIFLALFLSGSAQAGAGAIFEEGARAAGLDFVHFNGMTGEDYFPEMMGAGVALLDYDRDGDLDVYLVQGQLLGPEDTMEDALLPVAGEPPFSDRLYRNDLEWRDGHPVLRFTDVTEEAGISAHGYGMGVATADVDNDGDVDLYVTNFGPNQLWLNDGKGGFEEATAASGAGDERWSVSASFLDYDRDGRLDLFVGNYVDYKIATHEVCRLPNGLPDYCSPSAYQPVHDRLLHNGGGGRFANATARAGVNKAFGAALGVITADFNGDGFIDVYVANDGAENQLWMNDGKGRFTDESLIAGAAVNMEGKTEASMGVTAADFDGDGDVDLFMTHLTRETNTLYVNDGQGWFEDRTMALALGHTSLAYTGFGTAWFDYDNDGWLDLFSANGAVTKIEAQITAGEVLPLNQPNQLWRNRGAAAGYEDVSAQAGPALALEEVSRGAAFGDIDNDGDTDIVVSNNGGPARLLVNQLGNRNHWLGLRLTSKEGRDALGAVVELASARRSLTRRAHTDGSYASASDPRVLVGLGQARDAVTLTVQWPDGSRERFAGLAADRYHDLMQGDGQQQK